MTMGCLCLRFHGFHGPPSCSSITSRTRKPGKSASLQFTLICLVLEPLLMVMSIPALCFVRLLLCGVVLNVVATKSLCKQRT